MGKHHKRKAPPISTKGGAILAGEAQNLVEQMPTKRALGQRTRREREQEQNIPIDSKKWEPQAQSKSTQIDPDLASVIQNLVDQIPTADLATPFKRSCKEGPLADVPSQCDQSHIAKGKVKKLGKQHNPGGTQTWLSRW
ncbi:hypothetical protein GIB67_025807 [Kingdonia uniflora]|uniref:Uncharacterized protein n=1 Tax=Kingdonia uniflora TaxID=39325 RepID=A0A7J7NT67_9MAGN|nr:hypothetical protein GIB67_025807 [Kingdonia uniflora]